MSTLNHPGLFEARSEIIPDNAASGFAYFSIIPAVVFLLSEPYKRSFFVRFNAWQSILLFLSWPVVYALASILQSLLPSAVFLTMSLVQMAGLASFILWAIVARNAFNGKRTRLPLIGKLAAMQAVDSQAYRRRPFLPILFRPLKERAGAAVAFFFLAFGRFFSTLRPVSTRPSSTIEN